VKAVGDGGGVDIVTTTQTAGDVVVERADCCTMTSAWRRRRHLQLLYHHHTTHYDVTWISNNKQLQYRSNGRLRVAPSDERVRTVAVGQAD